VTGKWKLIIKSPMGAMPVEIDIVASGDKFTGTMTGQGKTNDIEGTIDGNGLAWSVKMTAPMPMTMSFAGTIDGDAMEGQVKAGLMGTFKFNGNRIS